jgi:hypothetical protein
MRFDALFGKQLFHFLLKKVIFFIISKPLSSLFFWQKILKFLYTLYYINQFLLHFSSQKYLPNTPCPYKSESEIKNTMFGNHPPFPFLYFHFFKKYQLQNYNYFHFFIVRTQNLGKSWEIRKRDIELKWFDIWHTSIHQSLLFDIFPWLFVWLYAKYYL